MTPHVVGDLGVALAFAARGQFAGEQPRQGLLGRDAAVDPHALHEGGEIEPRLVADEIARVDGGRLDGVRRAQADLPAAVRPLQRGVERHARARVEEAGIVAMGAQGRRRAGGPARRRGGSGRGRPPPPRRRSAGRCASSARPPGTWPSPRRSARRARSGRAAAKAIGMLTWSCRSLPTPGRSWTGTTSRASRSSAGPMPESSSRCGDPMAPVLSTTSEPAWTVSSRPRSSRSTPTTRPRSTTSRMTVTPVRSVRFGRSSAGRR